MTNKTGIQASFRAPKGGDLCDHVDPKNFIDDDPVAQALVTHDDANPARRGRGDLDLRVPLLCKEGGAPTPKRGRR